MPNLSLFIVNLCDLKTIYEHTSWFKNFIIKNDFANSFIVIKIIIYFCDDTTSRSVTMIIIFMKSNNWILFHLILSYNTFVDFYYFILIWFDFIILSFHQRKIWLLSMSTKLTVITTLITKVKVRASHKKESPFCEPWRTRQS